MKGYVNSAMDLEPDICGDGTYKSLNTPPPTEHDPANNNNIPLDDLQKSADDQQNINSDNDEDDFVCSGTGCRLGIDDNGKVVVIEWLDKEPAYDPYKHREVKRPTTYFDTLIHFLKASLGTGILAMPNAFMNAGYAIGTVGTLLIGILCTYTIHLLVDAAYELSIRKKVPCLTYPDAAAAAFENGGYGKQCATIARFVTKLLLLSYQIGTSSVYVVFISTNVRAVVRSYYFDNDADLRVYIMIIFLPLLLISWIQSLKWLSPFSSVANVLAMVSFGGIFYYMFHEESPSFVNRVPIGSVETIPMFFGTVLFAMEAIGMVLPLENEMKRPEKFSSKFGVLNAAMAPISILYSVVGLLGYMKYGENTRGSITLNLPEHEPLANAIKVMLTISICICYALSNFVSFNLMWRSFLKMFNIRSKKTLWSLALRTIVVTITFGIAIAVPELELLISLIGAACLSVVGIGMPAVISHLTFADERRKKGGGRLLFGLRNLLIVAVSAFAFVVGVYFSAVDIRDSLRQRQQQQQQQE